MTKMKVLIEKIKTGQTPEELFSRFAAKRNTSLLHSSLHSDIGRYSFIGIEPFLVLKDKGGADSFNLLDSIIKRYKIKNKSHFPFVAGGIGYLSYDLKDILEHTEPRAKDDLNLPDMYFVFYQALLIHDRLKPGEVYISVLDIKSRGYKKPDNLLKEIKGLLRPDPPSVGARFARCPRNDGKNVIASTDEVRAKQSHNLKSNFTKRSYISAVKRVIDYIRAGDIYQACLSQRFQTRWHGDPYQLYLRLNNINPAPMSAYLNFTPSRIISSSPELFLRLRNGRVETRPMKGTIRRGKGKKKDARLRKKLDQSAKDAAELAMIVDLERNDLGKICAPGSIKVAEHRRIETYPTVFQTVSIIRGKVKKGASVVDIIRAAFPGGSISGCPKIRAMEIIDELEPTRRAVYTGSIGYLSFHDTMDLNIAIRTMIVKDKRVYFQAGGGITALSNPEAEYTETLDKARALITSLAGQEK